MSQFASRSDGPVLPVADMRNRHVLIVDDEPSVREIFAMALEDLGLIVAQASTVAEGIPLVAGTRPEVVLTDWIMPGATGRAMVEHLLTIPTEQRPAILVISGNLMLDDHAWLAVVPGVVILDKPIPLDQLQLAVQRALGRRLLGRSGLP